MSLLWAPRILKYRCQRRSRLSWVRNINAKMLLFFSKNILFFKQVHHVDLKLEKCDKEML